MSVFALRLTTPVLQSKERAASPPKRYKTSRWRSTLLQGSFQDRGSADWPSPVGILRVRTAPGSSTWKDNNLHHPKEEEVIRWRTWVNSKMRYMRKTYSSWIYFTHFNKMFHGLQWLFLCFLMQFGVCFTLFSQYLSGTYWLMATVVKCDWISGTSSLVIEI